MIPETGTPSEFKQAWFEAAAIPLLDEVYAWVDGGTFRECWQIVGFSKPELRRVLIDVYNQGHSGRLERSVSRSSVFLPDWEKCIASGAVRYVGMKVPLNVILW